jgi:hypothetical protein
VDGLIISAEGPLLRLSIVTGSISSTFLSGLPQKAQGFPFKTGLSGVTT